MNLLRLVGIVLATSFVGCAGSGSQEPAAQAEPPAAEAATKELPQAPAPAATAKDWLAELPAEPSSLEITLRFRASPTTIASEADLVALLGGTSKKGKFFQVEYFDVAATSGPQPSWRRRSEYPSAASTKPSEVRLDFKFRQKGKPPDRPTCDAGWQVAEDIDATYSADGTVQTAFSTGCEKKSEEPQALPSGAGKVCSANMMRQTITTTNLGEVNGKLRIERWSIGSDTILEVSAQPETPEERAAARKTFDAAAALIRGKGVAVIDESKSELTRKSCP